MASESLPFQPCEAMLRFEDVEMEFIKLVEVEEVVVQVVDSLVEAEADLLSEVG